MGRRNHCLYPVVEDGGLLADKFAMSVSIDPAILQSCGRFKTAGALVAAG